MKQIFTFIVSFLVLFIGSFGFASAETKYTYYWSKGCGYCTNVNNYMEAVGAENKINIEKREIYEYPAKFTADIERLGLEPAKVGVPFMIVNNDGVETTLGGDAPIINHFIPTLGEAPENKNKPIVFAILGLLAVLVPFFIIKNSK